jgi:predicted AAA+ superfamily ATPase
LHDENDSPLAHESHPERRRPSSEQQLQYSLGRHAAAVRALTERFALVFVQGPPGSGKTSLARTLAADGAFLQSLEKPTDRRRLQSGASAMPLRHRQGSARNLLVIDNAQPVRVFAQIIELRTWIVAGWRLVCMASQRSEQVRRAICEHLPPAATAVDGRPAGSGFGVYNLYGMPIADQITLEPDCWPVAWFRGVLPASVLADDDSASHLARRDLIGDICYSFNPPIAPAYRIRTFENRMARVQRNLADDRAAQETQNAVDQTPPLEPFYQPRAPRPDALLRFARLAAHTVAQPLNFSALARSQGVAPHTAEAHFAVLERHILVARQPAFINSTRSRLVRRPRALFLDTGLLHAALEIPSFEELLAHPSAAQSWTNFVVNALCHHVGLPPAGMPFWATHTGLCVDALWRTGTSTPGGLCAVIATLEPRPRLNRVLRATCEQLQIQDLWLISPGNRSYRLSEQVQVLSIRDLPQLRIQAAPAMWFAPSCG